MHRRVRNEQKGGSREQRRGAVANCRTYLQRGSDGAKEQGHKGEECGRDHLGDSSPLVASRVEHPLLDHGTHLLPLARPSCQPRQFVGATTSTSTPRTAVGSCASVARRPATATGHERCPVVRRLRHVVRSRDVRRIWEVHSVVFVLVDLTPVGATTARRGLDAALDVNHRAAVRVRCFAYLEKHFFKCDLVPCRVRLVANAKMSVSSHCVQRQTNCVEMKQVRRPHASVLFAARGSILIRTCRASSGRSEEQRSYFLKVCWLVILMSQ